MGRILKKCLSNWPLKLLSVFLAVFVWFVIISLADPTDTKTVYYIPVQLLNEDMLKQAGKSYAVEGGENPTVSVKVRGKGSVIRELKSSDFTATADIQGMIDVNGSVPIHVTCSHQDIRDDQITPESTYITIKYEDIVSKTFAIEVISPEVPPEGYFVGNLSTSPRTVRVTAPSSVLDRIGNVVAEVDVSQMTESSQVEASLQYYTNTGDILQLDSFRDTRMGTVSCMVNVEIQTMKTVPVVLSQEAVDEMKAQVPDGYSFTGYSTLPMVQIKGLKSRLIDVAALTIPAGSLSLKEAREDREFELDLSYFLPEGIELMEGEEQLFKLTVFVDELVIREYTIRGIQVIGEQNGYRYDYPQTVTVRIRGLEDDFQGFDPATISVTLDLTEYAKKPGTYQLPLEVHCEDEEIFTPMADSEIEVTIKAENPPSRDKETTAAPTTAPKDREEDQSVD